MANWIKLIIDERLGVEIARFICPNCGRIVINPKSYCPRCGIELKPPKGDSNEGL